MSSSQSIEDLSPWPADGAMTLSNPFGDENGGLLSALRPSLTSPEESDHSMSKQALLPIKSFSIQSEGSLARSSGNENMFSTRFPVLEAEKASLQPSYSADPLASSWDMNMLSMFQKFPFKVAKKQFVMDLEKKMAARYPSPQFIMDEPPQTMYWPNLESSQLDTILEPSSVCAPRSSTPLIQPDDHLGRLTDIDKIIEDQQRVVSVLRDDHADKAGWLNNLGFSYMDRFRHLGKLTDIEKAIEVEQQAVLLMPDTHNYKPVCLTNLGISLTDRFKHLGDLADIDKAVEVQQKAVSLAPDGHPSNPRWLTHLGCLLTHRYKHLGELADINKAIEVQKQALSLMLDGHSDKPGCLHNLGGSLTQRFEHLGDLADIDKAIEFRKKALSLTPIGHTNKHRQLNDLGNSYTCRFKRLGELIDIDEAIKVQQQAVLLIPDGHADKPSCLDNLGGSYTSRFGHLGELSDIDKAIEVRQQIVSLAPAHYTDKFRQLMNLGSSYIFRFKYLEELEDIDKAIEIQQKAVLLTPIDHADRPACLNTLGASYTHRFEDLRELKDIEKAIEIQQQAVSLTPDGHNNKPSWFCNLGTSYTLRFEYLGELVDIDNAIRLQRQAILLVPDGHGNKPVCLNSLGTSYASRFMKLRELVDIERAIDVQQKAVSLIPDSHIGKPDMLTGLGASYMYRFEHLLELDDINKAIELYQKAATSLSGPPSVRFRSAHFWTFLNARVRRPKLPADQLLGCYEMLIRLLPEVIWLGTSVKKRFEHVRGLVGGFVNDALATAIEAQRYELAVEWLEQGRSIIWGQILHLRSPVDELRVAHPGLADDLEQVSKQLENASLRSFHTEGALRDPFQDVSLSLEQQAQAHRRIAKRREDILSKIRSLPGFANFLEPEPFATLSAAACIDPVILLNVSASRCDALVLSCSKTDPIVHIPLPNFSLTIAEELFTQLRSFRSGNIERSPHCEEARKPSLASSKQVQPLQVLLADLWTLLVYPVLQRIERLTVDRSIENIPRVTWCTTGHLSFLPLHAAGIYGSSDLTKDINISDFVVSSYTPTLKSLLQRKAIRPSPPRVLIVTQPHAPGHAPIRGTVKEANLVTDVIERHKSQFKHLSDGQASSTTVLENISQFDWVHLACHGIQHPIDPLQSAFVLAGGHLKLDALMAESLDRAQLAFLSACQTATGDKSLPEESVHLTAGMLTAGFQSVVGTMWPIGDEDAPVVAEAFYSQLFKEGSELGWKKQPDSARALHQAVKRLREKVGDLNFEKWVPFVHFGL